MAPSNKPITRAEIENEVKRLGFWYQDFELPCGVRTGGGHPRAYPAEERWKFIEPYVPADLTGATVLDTGGNAGFFSIQMKLRGARRCVLVDPFVEFARQAEFAARQFGVELEIVTEDVHTYCLTRSERFDYVLFLGLFYHLKYPGLVLDRLAEMTKQRMYFQSHLVGSEEDSYEDQANYVRVSDDGLLREPGFPRLVFIEKLYNADDTNWWIPNYTSLEPLLRSAGMKVIARPHAQVLVAEPEEYFGKIEFKRMVFPRYGKRGTGRPYAEAAPPSDDRRQWFSAFASKPERLPVIGAKGAVNAASYSAVLAPGLLSTIFGVNFARDCRVAPAGRPLPTSLGGVRVLLNKRPVPLSFVSAAQINFLVPWDLRDEKEVTLAVKTRAGTSNVLTVMLAAVSPAIFTLNAEGQSAIFEAGTNALAAAEMVGGKWARPVARGASLVIHCAGLGAVNSSVPAFPYTAAETVEKPQVAIGGIPARVKFSSLAPQAAGTYHVEVEVPEEAPSGKAVPVWLAIGGVGSNTVTIAVQ